MPIITKWLRTPFNKQSAIWYSVSAFGVPMAVVVLWLFDGEGGPLVSVVLAVVALFGGYIFGLLMWHFFLKSYSEKPKSVPAQRGN